MDHRESAKRIAQMAWKTARQLNAAGITHYTKEDLEQEFWAVWCRARDTFDPTQGVPFEAYLVNGINRFVQFEVKKKAFKRIEESWAKSFDEKVGGEDDERTVGDTIADDRIDNTEFEEDSQFAFLLTKLSDRAATFLRLLRTQPEPIVTELERLKDRSDWAKSQKVANMCFSSITQAMIFKVMDADRTERTSILAEIRKLSDKMMRKAA